MATTLEREVRGRIEPKAPSGRSRSGWWMWVLSAVAVLTVVVAVAVALWPEPDVRPDEQGQVASGSLYTEQEELVRQLVAQGLVPGETLDGGVYRIKQLINEGLIPAATVQAGTAPVESLYTPQELIVMHLVAQGLVPRQTLDGGTYLIKRLVNEGRVPGQPEDAAGQGRN
jgi:hypothetical protein